MKRNVKLDSTLAGVALGITTMFGTMGCSQAEKAAELPPMSPRIQQVINDAKANKWLEKIDLSKLKHYSCEEKKIDEHRTKRIVKNPKGQMVYDEEMYSYQDPSIPPSRVAKVYNNAGILISEHIEGLEATFDKVCDQNGNEIVSILRNPDESLINVNLSKYDQNGNLLSHFHWDVLNNATRETLQVGEGKIVFVKSPDGIETIFREDECSTKGKQEFLQRTFYDENGTPSYTERVCTDTKTGNKVFLKATYDSDGNISSFEISPENASSTAGMKLEDVVKATKANKSLEKIDLSKIQHYKIRLRQYDHETVDEIIDPKWETVFREGRSTRDKQDLVHILHDRTGWGENYVRWTSIYQNGKNAAGFCVWALSGPQETFYDQNGNEIYKHYYKTERPSAEVDPQRLPNGAIVLHEFDEKGDSVSVLTKSFEKDCMNEVIPDQNGIPLSIETRTDGRVRSIRRGQGLKTETRIEYRDASYDKKGNLTDLRTEVYKNESGSHTKLLDVSITYDKNGNITSFKGNDTKPAQPPKAPKGNDGR